MTRLFRSRLQGIISELQSVLNEVDVRSVDELARALLRARKIFIYGQGRTGHVSRTFAVRLMHLGMDAHFVGETTTPPITRRDLCLVNSGTGQTRFVYHVAAAAKEAGARLATITAHPEARIAAMADIVVVVPAPTKGEVNRNQDDAPAARFAVRAGHAAADGHARPGPHGPPAPDPEEAGEETRQYRVI